VSSDDDYSKLRSLLLNPEFERFSQLEHRLDNPEQRVQELTPILPTALQTCSETQLAAALHPAVEHCVKQSVQQDPHSYVKALLPVMGPLLRKNIAEAFKVLREFLGKQQEQLIKLEQQVDQLDHAKFAQLQTQVTQIEQEMTARLHTLETYFETSQSFAKHVADILPEAIQQANAESNALGHDSELSRVLRQPVEQCIKQSVSEHTQAFADSIFPVMGPAIRKSIHEAFKTLLQSINRSIEQSLSPKGLIWRIEAMRSGRPFAEIVLQKTLLYRVEQVFLIHRETGLLIRHLHQEGIGELADSDAVSAMFTAIQDFIRDSFSTDKKAELDSVELGDYVVWLERGPYAVLACVIRGVAPYDFRELMRTLLEFIHAKYRSELEHFSGDNTPLEPCGSTLERALQSQQKTDVGRAQLYTLIALGMMGLAFIGLLFSWGYIYFHYHQRLQNYVIALNRIPGIVVVETQYTYNGIILRGLRDPLAPAPDEFLEQFRLSSDDVQAHWSSYQDLSPEFVEKRLHLWLKPPATVKLSVRDNILYTSGLAEQMWIDKAMSVVGMFSIIEVRSELLDRASFLEQKAREWLSPPASVHCKVIEDILYLRGHAPLSWKERAAQVVTAVPDLKQVNLTELLDTDSFLLQQAKSLLNPSEQLDLTVKDAVLTLRGRIDAAHFEAIEKKLPALKGFTKIDDGHLLNEEKIQKLVQTVENSFIYFLDDVQMVANQEEKLQTLLTTFQSLIVAHRQVSVQFQITGYTDGTGTRSYNIDLSERRARVLIDWLIAHGIPKDRILTVDPSEIRSDETRPDPSQRKVGIRVIRATLQGEQI